MRAIGILQRILSESLETVHQARIKVVFWAACSLLIGGRLTLTALGRSAKGKAYPKHCIKRVDRLMGNRPVSKRKIALPRT